MGNEWQNPWIHGIAYLFVKETDYRKRTMANWSRGTTLGVIHRSIMRCFWGQITQSHWLNRQETYIPRKIFVESGICQDIDNKAVKSCEPVSNCHLLLLDSGNNQVRGGPETTSVITTTVWSCFASGCNHGSEQGGSRLFMFPSGPRAHEKMGTPVSVRL